MVEIWHVCLRVNKDINIIVLTYTSMRSNNLDNL